MKKVAEIENIISFAVEKGIPFLLSSDFNNLKWKSILNCSILADDNVKKSNFFRVENYWLRSLENFGAIYAYDKNSECVKKFPEGFNLPSSKLWSNGNLLIPNKDTKTHWELSSQLEITDTTHLFEFDKCIDGRYYIYMYPPNLITRVNISTKGIVWQVKLTDLLDIPSADKVTLWDQPLTHRDRIYFQLERGELFAIGTETGSLEWVIKHDECGIMSICDDKIYKRDNTLYKICAITGRVEQEKSIRDIVGKTFWATGRISVCKNIIILWSTSDSEVILVDSRDFSLIDIVKIHSIGIANDDRVIRWDGSRLYVLDMEQTLHIFEID